MIKATNPNFVIPNSRLNKKSENKYGYNLIPNSLNRAKNKRITFGSINSGDMLRDLYQKLHLSAVQICISEHGAVQRTRIPLVGQNCEQGLNKIIGLESLKKSVYDDILTPLLVFPERINLSKPSGIMFFGPKGTGKTYFAKQMGEHYALKGGYFEDLSLSGDVNKDINYLETKFSEAESRFIKSGRKKYTMFFIDEMEKKLDKDNSLQRPVINKLLELSQNCNNKGVVLVSTANYLDKVPQELLATGRTDMLIPIDYVSNDDMASLINYYIKMDHLPVAISADIDKIAKEIKKKRFKLKPKDIEKILIDEARDLVDYGGELNNDSLKRIFIDVNPEFDKFENEQFNRDKEYAKSLGMFYNYTDNVTPAEEFKSEMLKLRRKMLGVETEKVDSEEQSISLKRRLCQALNLSDFIKL